MGAFDDMSTSNSAFSDMPSKKDNPLLAKLGLAMSEMARSESEGGRAAGEGALTTLLGATSWIPMGIANVADIGAAAAAGEKPTFEMGKNVGDFFTYTPKTEGGKAITSAVQYPFEKLGELQKITGEKIYKETDNPALAAAAETIIGSIPFVAPYGAAKGISKLKKATSLENLKDVIPEKQGKPTSITPEVKSAFADMPTEEIKPVQDIAKPEIVQPGATSEAVKPAKEIKPELTAPEAELQPHRTAQRVEVEAISKELLNREGLGEDIAKYEVEKGMMDKQAQLGVEIMDKDWDSAVKMALGEMDAPAGVRPGTMITSVSRRAFEKGDYETIYKLGTTESAHTAAQETAKDLKSFDQGLTNDPVTAIRSVVKARQEENVKTGTKVDPAKQSAEVERLNTELKAAQKKLDEYASKRDVAKRPPKYGADNKIVTQTEYLKVKQELREQFSTQLSAGLDPTIAAKLGKIGVYHLEAGARSFKVWSERLVADVGEWVQPHLADLWKQSNEAIGKPVKTPEEVNLQRYKTRLKNEEAKLTGKLENLDFKTEAKRITALDAEGRKLKTARDRAKVAYNVAVRKTGTVTKEEAGKLLDLAKTAAELKTKYDPAVKENHGFPTAKDRLEYGRAQVAFERYVAELKEGDQSLSSLVKRRAAEFKNTFSANPVGAVKDLAVDVLGEISDSSIALVASLDNSFIGRQGLLTLQTHPTIWASAAKKSFSDIYKALRDKHGNEVAKDILHADLVSRENYMNGNYQKAGILATFEEQYPTSHPARIPYIGRAFKASEIAFTNSALRMRIGTFDLLMDMAKKQGLEINQVLIKDIGSVVNSATARAKTKDSKFVKNILWAPKMMVANYNVLTGHSLSAGLKTGFARKQAAYNWMKMVGETAAVAATLNALNPRSVETDPRSSDFLKYRDGNTRIDLTAGRGQYITLAARWLSGQTKNAQTKIVKELDAAGFGNRTYFDVGMDFLINKTTPLVRQGVYYAKGKNFEGKQPTPERTLAELTTPIPVKNFYDNLMGDYPDQSATALIGNIADVFGVNANTYQPLSQWENSDSKKINKLKKNIGEERVNQKNIKYNMLVNKKIDDLVKTDRYQRLNEEDKQKKITALKAAEKKKIVGF